jgi:transposase
VIFKEIDDEFWEIVRPYLPAQKAKTGRPRADLRKSFNRILYVLRTGINWMDIPRIYGEMRGLIMP